MQDRKDMSIGARNYDKGYDKGYSKGSNERYMNSMKGMKEKVMRHASNVKGIETCNAEQYDMGRMEWRPYNRRGYDRQAFDYKW